MTFKVRDKRNKGWFYIDNEYLNGLGRYLGPTCIAVYVSLCRHANNNQECFPSQTKIAEEIGSTDRSVRRAIKKLEEHNVIRLIRERKSGGQWLNNTYYLLDKVEWVYPKDTISYGSPEDKNDTTRGHHFLLRILILTRLIPRRLKVLLLKNPITVEKR